MSPSTPVFTLRSVVAAVLAESPDPDPHTVAEAVLARLAETDLRGALAEMLPAYVRELIRVERNTVTCGSSSPAPGRSWKVEALQEYGRILRLRVHVGAGPLDWKFLGDCEADDLRAAAEERREIAARTAAMAERYERLLKAVEHYGAQTVRELPSDALAEAWGA